MKEYEDVDAYVKAAPEELAPRLRDMRALIRKLAPQGDEVISYGMPTIKLEGKNLVHFASMKGHLGFYPGPTGVTAYEDELKEKGIDYSKGCIRFSYAKPLPEALIAKIVRFRLKEEKGA